MDASGPEQGAWSNPFEPLIDAIAEAVVRKIEERRRIDAIAEAVLRRLEELRALAPSPVQEEDDHSANETSLCENETSLCEDELHQIVLDVLASIDGAKPVHAD
jgi:hypothetical protein